MSLSDEQGEARQSVTEDYEEGSPSSPGLFVGDSGELPAETRRALVRLLAGPSLDGHRHPNLWPVLLRDEEMIRRRLAELFLHLIIDRDLKVAFTRQVETEDLDAPKLLRRAQLTFIDSVLLLHLRRRLMQADARGERAVVSAGEITADLEVYRQSANTDRAGFTKRINSSIEKMKKNNILQKIPASEDRFEISPTLKLLFSAEEIQTLTGNYRRMAAGDAAGAAAAADIVRDEPAGHETGHEEDVEE